MRRITGRTLRLVAAALLLAATAPTLPSLAAAALASGAPVVAQDPPPPAKCCFTNPRYSGTCEVEPAKDESCGTILGYLNNPMSQGKSYCGNTAIRGGWQSVSCTAAK
jgi:hypothetical protein